MLVVLGLVAILLSFCVPRLEGLVPKYSLRSAVRNLGSTLEFIRTAAISRERWIGVHYVLDPPGDSENPYYQIIPPAPEDNPNQPIEQRELETKDHLPTGVRFARILLAGNQVIDRGAVNILFSPTGSAGSHAVVLVGGDDRFASLKFNCITGIMDFVESDQVAFEHFED
jgi:type II secretory pathway pseudopilin PulG